MIYSDFDLDSTPSLSKPIPGNAPINEGLTLEDSPYEFPQDRLGAIAPGWDLMIKACSEDLWVRVVGEEPGGFVCQVIPVPTDTNMHGLKQGDLVFVRPRNIEAASQAATFERNGSSFEQTHTTVQPLPGGQSVTYSRSSLFVDGDD